MKIEAILAKFGRERLNLIPILHEIQAQSGYVSPEAMQAVAVHLGLSDSEVYGVVTFYTAYKLKPAGRHSLKVCRGTACHVKGSEKIIGEIEKQLGISDGGTTGDGEYSFETVACLGSCALGPVVVRDGRVYGRVTPAQVKDILRGDE
ncbi:MAG: NADH-quinone oxidoreductase subunit NuoE [Dehalococcoidia bacterium]|nr:NADH-quinone oxidoreductase subunit NuoE [Dehalococcoidia bacterium]